MKKIVLLGLFCFLLTNAFAQVGSDSLAYQLQRKKINSMLAVRSQKFSKYDKSLSEHTGIFGLQTKKDIRRSNEILMDIVRTDNDIYKQLKILLDYRTFQQSQVLDKSKETESTALGFMYTINKLRSQVDILKAQALVNEKHEQKVTTKFIIIIVVLVLILLFSIRKHFEAKKQV
jgi:hypothetical protein